MQKRVLTIVSAALAGLVLAGPAFAQSAGKGAAAGGAPNVVEQITQPVSDWLERANREYQANVVHELSVPTGKGASLEASKAAPVSGGLPALLGQMKEYLGIETAKTPQDVAEAAKREEALGRQIEARKLEQDRNAEQQRVAEQQLMAAEAKKGAEIADLTTKQNQKAAEIARLAEEERRKTTGKAPASSKTPENKTAEAETAKADEKAGADRATAERKAVAAAEKAAADKVTAERKVTAEPKVAADRKAAAEHKAMAAAENAAADKAASERKAVAAAEEAQRLREEAALKEQKQKAQAATDAAKKLAQATPNVGVKTEPAKPESAPSKSSKAAAARSTEQAAMTTQGTQKAVKKTKVALREPTREKRSGKGGRCSGAGRDVDLPATYVVKSGDTLWDISRRYYDKGMRFEKIVRANQDKIGSPDLIYPCQKFFLPGRSALYWALPLEDFDAS